jgi:hypothetical protein
LIGVTLACGITFQIIIFVKLVAFANEALLQVFLLFNCSTGFIQERHGFSLHDPHNIPSKYRLRFSECYSLHLLLSFRFLTFPFTPPFE